MAERSTPESRRRAAYKQMQADADKDKRKRNIPQPEPMVIPRSIQRGERSTQTYRSGTKGEQAAAMLGAADIVTAPLMAGQLAKWAGRGVKHAFSALARKKALEKMPREGVRGIRNVGDSRPHDAPKIVPGLKKGWKKFLHGTEDPVRGSADWKAGKYGKKGLLDYAEGYKEVAPWVVPSAAVIAVSYKKQWDRAKKREAEKKETGRSRTAWRIQQDAEASKDVPRPASGRRAAVERRKVSTKARSKARLQAKSESESLKNNLLKKRVLERRAEMEKRNSPLDWAPGYASKPYGHPEGSSAKPVTKVRKAVRRAPTKKLSSSREARESKESKKKDPIFPGIYGGD